MLLQIFINAWHNARQMKSFRRYGGRLMSVQTLCVCSACLVALLLIPVLGATNTKPDQTELHARSTCASCCENIAFDELAFSKSVNCLSGLRNSGNEFKSGVVYLDLIQRLDSISADMKANDLHADADTIKSLVSKLRTDARSVPWSIETHDQNFISVIRFSR